jgi:predicted permease
MKWWQRFLEGKQLEQELDAELRDHVQRQVADNIRSGMSQDDALRRAHAQVGGLDQVKEACRDVRGTRWVEEVVQDLRFAARLLVKDRPFTLAAVATLALAIGVNTAMFSVIESVLLAPLPYPEPGRMLWISENDLRGPNKLAMVFAQDVEEWRTRAQTLDALSVLLTGDATIGRDDPVQVRVASVSESLTKLFGVPPAMGRDFTAQDFQFAPQAPGLRAAPENRSDTGVAIFSERLMRRLGRDSSILGEPVTINNVQYTVIGVLPLSFRLPVAPSLQLGVGAQTDVDVVVNTALGHTYRGPGALLGRLKSGVVTASAFTELEEIRKVANQSRAQNESSSHLSLQVMSLHDYVVSETRTVLLVIWAAVGFVLLVACVNIVNLLLARAVARQQETALRAALGAGRWRLMRQMLTENMMLVFVGGVTGLLLGYAIVRALGRTSAIDVPRLQDVTISWPVLLFSAAVCVCCGLLLSIIPAAESYRGVASRLKTSTTTAGGSARRWHSLLVVCELALVMIPLTGAGLMLRSLSAVWAESAASAPRQVLMARLQDNSAPGATSPPERLRQNDRLLSDVESLPGVRAAAFWGVTFGYPARISGLASPDGDAVAMWFNVSPRFQETAGLRLLAGRWLTEADRVAAPPVVVVSERFARMFTGGQPDFRSVVGRTTIGPFAPPGSADREGPMMIIGVASDFRSGRLGILRPDDRNALPQVFFPDALRPVAGGELLVRTTSSPLSAVGSLRNVVQGKSNFRLVSVRTLDSQLSAALAPRSFNTLLITSFASIAAVLAIVGVSGVLRYSVAQRTHEIGLRLALGAEPREVVRMIIAQAALLVIAGVCVGLAGSAVVARLMSSVLYGVRPIDPRAFLAVTVLIVVAALIAAYLPAHRAARVDPLKALRHE